MMNKSHGQAPLVVQGEALVTLSPLKTNHKMSENSHASPRGQGQHLFSHYEV